MSGASGRQPEDFIERPDEQEGDRFRISDEDSEETSPDFSQEKLQNRTLDEMGEIYDLTPQTINQILAIISGSNDLGSEFSRQAPKPRRQANRGAIENFSPEDVDESPVNASSDSGLNHLIDLALLKHPQASLYALALVIFMFAFYLSNPYVGLAGAVMMITTSLHYAE